MPTSEEIAAALAESSMVVLNDATGGCSLGEEEGGSPAVDENPEIGEEDGTVHDAPPPTKEHNAWSRSGSPPVVAGAVNAGLDGRNAIGTGTKDGQEYVAKVDGDSSRVVLKASGPIANNVTHGADLNNQDSGFSIPGASYSHFKDETENCVPLQERPARDKIKPSSRSSPGTGAVDHNQSREPAVLGQAALPQVQERGGSQQGEKLDNLLPGVVPKNKDKLSTVTEVHDVRINPSSQSQDRSKITAATTSSASSSTAIGRSLVGPAPAAPLVKTIPQRIGHSDYFDDLESDEDDLAFRAAADKEAQKNHELQEEAASRGHVEENLRLHVGNSGSSSSSSSRNVLGEESKTHSELGPYKRATTSEENRREDEAAQHISAEKHSNSVSNVLNMLLTSTTCAEAPAPQQDECSLLLRSSSAPPKPPV
ncbi:unnamed protein product, partial [Amoebophrya sp. A120]|eukprot:GSA120T00018153001.1